MRKRTFAILVTLGLISPVVVNSAQQQVRRTTQPQTAPAKQLPATNLMPVDARNAFVKQYCAACHNDTVKSGGMTLTSLDMAHPELNGELAEKVIRKLRAGMMPPANAAKKPDVETAKLLVTTLETEIDKIAALKPNPGSRPFQRLTRDEYARSVRDLLGIDVDVAQFLPPDTLSDGLDNIADSQSFTASLMEGYMRAAAKISRDALGDPKATPASAVFKLPRTGSQLRRVEGTPYGTRGGISVVYNFPADG